jgi:glycerol-3-phosphate dehydrogenase
MIRPPESFNIRSRSSLFRSLSSTSFDLLVIGGGITGASILRDAAKRGLSVALVEARDFAVSTSSRSSKLVHGGLRYLKSGSFNVTWGSCHERDLHVHLNRRLVTPEPFMIPLYSDRGTPKRMVKAGMIGYELMSGLKNYQFHRSLTRAEVLLRAPGIDSLGLIGGYEYYDAVVSDNRFTIETIKDGVHHGGLALNYAPVRKLIKEKEICAGAVVKDELTGAEYTVRAAAIVNATGVFADTIRHMDDPQVVDRIALSKGTHLVFESRDIPSNTTIAFSSPIDNRLVFLIRYEGCFLFGTTDDWEHNADMAHPTPAPKDCRYLIKTLSRFMPGAAIDLSRVAFSYAGYRPLVMNTGSERSPDKVSRGDVTEISSSGLISIMGGKLTTARRMAEKIVDIVVKKSGKERRYRNCTTDRDPIGGSNDEVADGVAFWTRHCPELKEYITDLFKRYGSDGTSIVEEAVTITQGRHPDPKAEPIRAEVQYVCRNEMVCTLEDLIERRAGYLVWSREKRLERLMYGAHIIKQELGLDEDTYKQQYEEYRAGLEHFHTCPGN